MNRRSYLGSAGVLATAGLAGCPGVGSVLDSESKLGRLSVVNWDDTEDHTIEVTLERDGTVVHEATYTVGKMEGNEAQAVVADCTWDDDAGAFALAARLAGSTDWRRFDLLAEAAGTPDCVIAALQYGFASGVPHTNPLNVEVRDRCDEIGDHYEGGCPAYTS